MKHQIGDAFSSCMLGVAELTGCTISISPTTPDSSSVSATQSEQEEVPSSDSPAVSEPTASPQTELPTTSPVPQSTGAESSAALSESGDNGGEQEYTDLSFLTDDQ